MRLEKPSDFKPDTAYMEVPRCDRCKWWEKNGREHGRGFSSGNGVCIFLSAPGRLFGWPDRHAIAYDIREGRYETAIFGTAPDFGCVQFEERIEANAS